jgi:DNA-binding NarL/FixJ family response regulator
LVADPPAISERQREVLRKAALGQTYGEIGLDLYVSEHTVKNHLQQVYRKLGAHCLTDALRAMGWLVVPQ